MDEHGMEGFGLADISMQVHAWGGGVGASDVLRTDLLEPAFGGEYLGQEKID